MDEHELRILGDRVIDELALGRDPGHDPLHLPVGRDLQPVRAEILEIADRQELVEVGDHCGDGRHTCPLAFGSP